MTPKVIERGIAIVTSLSLVLAACGAKISQIVLPKADGSGNVTFNDNTAGWPTIGEDGIRCSAYPGDIVIEAPDTLDSNTEYPAEAVCTGLRGTPTPAGANP